MSVKPTIPTNGPLVDARPLVISSALLTSLNEILDAVILVLRGKFGNIELHDPARQVVQIVAHRGFSADFLKAIGTTSVNTGLAGAQSIRSRKRVVIADVNTDPEYEPYRELAMAAGYRTIQATPLLSGDQEALGALLTYLPEPRDFYDYELQVLDLYARQAADAILRVRAEQNLATARGRLEAALRVGEMGIYDWNMLTNRVYGDTNFQRMAGVTFDKDGFASREALNDRIHPDDREERLKRVRRVISTGQPYEAEYRIITDGEPRWVISRGMVENDSDGTPRHFTGVLVDISSRKKAEEALLEADRQKNAFLVQLAHELRNPLAAVRNAARILSVNPTMDGNGIWASEMIERQVKHLSRLIDDLLDISRINRNAFELRKQKTELQGIVNAALEMSSPIIEQKRHKLTVHMPPGTVSLFADGARLTQALMNVLTNAAKYTDPGGHIELTAGMRNDQVVISVRDNGIGLEASTLSKVFTMFFQVDTSLERAQEGLGIGLSLVRSLVELHGGTVEARSDGLGFGSEFILHVPVQQSEETQPAAVDAEVGVSGVARRVLVVDDNRDAAESIAMFLRVAGHVVDTAFDGEEALVIAERFRPEVALIDLGLPKLNGYDVCRRIRDTAWGKNLMLIAQTGWGREEDKANSRDAGFDGHLVKPADPMMVLKIVDRAAYDAKREMLKKH